MSDESSTVVTPGESNHAALVGRYHDLAVRTQNPVFFWLALQQVLAHGAGSADASPLPVTIPGWMCAYLHDAAARIGLLAQGVDYRKELPPMNLEAFISDGEPWGLDEILRSPEMRERAATIAIDPAKAMRVVPEALGLIEGTTNNFSEFLSSIAKMQEARFYEAATTAGVAAKVAVGAIAKGSDAKAQSDRQIYERIRNGRDLL